MYIYEVITQAKLVVGPALEHAFAADAEAREELHKVRIAVGNAQTREYADAPVDAFFWLIQILVKIVVNVPRTFLSPERAVLDGVHVQPLIDRSKLFVGKSRAEKLMPGESEKVRSHPTLAGNDDGVAVQILNARSSGITIGRHHKETDDSVVGIFGGYYEQSGAQGRVRHRDSSKWINVKCLVHEIGVAFTVGKLVHVAGICGDGGELTNSQTEVGRKI